MFFVSICKKQIIIPDAKFSVAVNELLIKFVWI